METFPHQRVLMRGDANAAIGSGHIMRLLALGAYLQELGSEVDLAVTSCPEILKKRAEAGGCGFHEIAATPGMPDDAIATTKLVRELGASLVILDGYHFGHSVQNVFRNQGIQTLLFDDYGHSEYYKANYVINQNQSWHPSYYERREQGCQVFGGCRYAVLRQSFREFSPEARREIGNAERILLNVGQSDPRQLSLPVARAILESGMPEPLHLRILLGSMAEATPALEELANDAGPHQVEIIREEGEILPLLNWADLAVTASGSILWELFYLGVPVLGLITANNQAANAEALSSDQAMASYNLLKPDAFDPQAFGSAFRTLAMDGVQRASYSVKGRSLVDGKGCERIVEKLFGTGASSTVGARASAGSSLERLASPGATL